MGICDAALRTPVLTLRLDAPTIGTVDEIADFLAQFSPFDTLSRDELLHVAATVAIRSYPAGTDILIEDGPPSSCVTKTRWWISSSRERALATRPC
jgi:hypothetical protein